MFEVLFILTTIFVAYVVYEVVNEKKSVPKPEAPKVSVEQPVPETIVEKIKPTKIKSAALKKTTPKAATQNIVKKGLRDPKTGEVATTYNNYRFTKRWIKDALVTEGLLEKVYKNNELDPVIEALIKSALIKLEAIDNYKP
ncbi:hypothetical protein [Methylobacter sp. S3L5C]|uniref:hypothetical protein n=1 Tax=Methylobacter sp. S3L5C TaxID=2839024 RepID=UPI001FAD40C4|nr:hypothetical protein [Methylobacter sp. S3L5C]UOA09488.1 hypothetical protein KKZ03_04115 [Methylobacter sp. S3L5C]